MMQVLDTTQSHEVKTTMYDVVGPILDKVVVVRLGYHWDILVVVVVLVDSLVHPVVEGMVVRMAVPQSQLGRVVKVPLDMVELVQVLVDRVAGLVEDGQVLVDKLVVLGDIQGLHQVCMEVFHH